MNDKRPVGSGRPDASVMCEKRLPASSSIASIESGECVTMVGPNFRVGKKIGCGNFGELRLGESPSILLLDF